MSTNSFTTDDGRVFHPTKLQVTTTPEGTFLEATCKVCTDGLAVSFRSPRESLNLAISIPMTLFDSNGRSVELFRWSTLVEPGGFVKVEFNAYLPLGD